MISRKMGVFLVKNLGSFCEYTSMHSLLIHPSGLHLPGFVALSVVLAFAFSLSPPSVQSRKPPVWHFDYLVLRVRKRLSVLARFSCAFVSARLLLKY